MAFFTGTAAVEFFNGTDPFDILSYAASPSAVTVDVDGTGIGGDADGDTYSAIELFSLSAFGDTFLGSALDEAVAAGAGDDTLRGGDGADNLNGDAGNDVFIVGDGEVGAGDFLNGGADTDTIRLVSASASAVFDLASAAYTDIEVIDFEGSGTLIVSDNGDAAITSGSAATDQTIQVGAWIGGADLANIFSDLVSYLSSGIETVTWTEGTGDVSAELVGGQVVINYVNNGAVAADYETLTLVMETADGALAKSDETLDTGIRKVFTYDTSGGIGNEMILTQSYTDVSPLNDAAPYEMKFFDYASDGVVDEILDYDAIISDAGLVTENTYIGGVLSTTFYTDLSFDGLLENYFIQQNGFYGDGVTPQYQITWFDPTEPYSVVEIYYDMSGAETLRINTSQDFTIVETVTTGAVTTRVFTTVPGDLIVAGDGDDEIYEVGTGASIYQANGGNDLFQLSETETDGTWGSFSTFIAQAETSSFLGGNFANAPLGISLSGKAQITDVFEGGAGEDTLQGTAGNEAFLLYDATNLAINPTLAADAIRLDSVEVIDMGAGNDDVNLSSSLGRAEYTVDTQIFGGDGVDYLVGGAGNDTISGGADGAVDRMAGWKGDDELIGAAGEEDRFLFFADVDNGTDTIVDFTTGEDCIYMFGYEFTDLASALVGGMTIVDDGTDTTITLGANTTIIVEGVLAADLDAGDFCFF